jgi:hypothetical protein
MNRMPLGLGKRLALAAAYVGIFIPVWLCAALLWHVLVEDVLYYCSDNAPFLDFLPPFVHGGATGDHYLVPAAIVYGLWCALVAAVLVLPAVVIRSARRRLESRARSSSAA